MADVKKIATRDSYGSALAELGAAHPDLIVFDADLAGATKTGTYSRRRSPTATLTAASPRRI